MVPEVLRHLESESLVANLPIKGPIVSRLDLNEAKQIDQIRVAVGGRATVRGAARPAIVEALEASKGSANVTLHGSAVRRPHDDAGSGTWTQ